MFPACMGGQELRGFSAVANCTGLGAARLFGDTEMYPVRGHVIRVRAPWVKCAHRPLPGFLHHRSPAICKSLG